MSVYNSLCECLQRVPDFIFDEITATSNQFEQGAESEGRAESSLQVDIVSALYVRCHLISSGVQSLSWLNEIIDIIAENYR